MSAAPHLRVVPVAPPHPLAAAAAALPPHARPWVMERRRRGLGLFRAAGGLPTTRLERWKYTDLSALERALKSAPSVEPYRSGLRDLRPGWIPPGTAVGIVDGVRPVFFQLTGDAREHRLFMPTETGDANEAWGAALLGSLAEPDRFPMAALAEMFLEEVQGIRIERGHAMETTVDLTFRRDGRADGTVTVVAPRRLIELGEGAELTLIERIAGTGAVLCLPITEVVLRPGARLRHVRIADEGAGGWTLATTVARIERDASYERFALNLGGGLARDELEAVLAGPGAFVRLDGASVVGAGAHLDTTSRIVHAAPHGRSNQDYGHVVGGGGRAVFQGKIQVEPGARKTDGYQLNRSLLLARNAEIDAKPELEIYADDVKCSHGATVGQLDRDALYYLRARGVPLPEARRLLIQAFLAGGLSRIDEWLGRDELASRAADAVAGLRQGWEADRA